MNYCDKSKWTVSCKKIDNGNLTLLCFPYAGGSAAAFESWGNCIPDNVNMVVVELPGHGMRLSEKPIDDFEMIVDKVTKAFAPFLSSPYIIFGHSMGAILAFEFVRHLERLGLPIPIHLFLSAQYGPRIKIEPNYNLPDDEFIYQLKKKGGTPAEVLASKELMECFLPMIRLDHKLVETYCDRYKKEPSLKCPITIFAGLDDAIPKESLESWRDETSECFDIKYLPGGHFFIFQQQEIIIPFMLKKVSAIA